MDKVVIQNEAVLTAYLPNKPQLQGAIIICPGGAYRRVTPREGEAVAKAFNKEGYGAFVLDYCVENPPLYTKPLSQLAEAMAYIRANAAKFQLREDRIGVCGFSAGGHLAGSLGVYWHEPGFFGGDKKSSMYRPDALILCYAVLSGGEFRHKDSYLNLVGESSNEVINQYSLETKVTGKTPPTFLWHTSEDQSVPVENTLLFSTALAKHKIPFEAHIYPYGVHGLSLATKETAVEKQQINPHASQWFASCINWLKLLWDC